MKIQNKKGFTLIELLVVITIMGILATAATATFTSQIQKARDATRTSDIKALQWWIEQVFQDLQMYPWKATTVAASTSCSNPTTATSANTSVYCAVSQWYVNKLPKDPKSGQAWNWSALEYTYNVGNKDWVLNQVYELSHWVESNWSKTAKASNTVDSWNDNQRAEFGHPAENLKTCTNWNAACAWSWDSASVAIAAATLSCTAVNGTDTSVLIKWNCP